MENFIGSVVILAVCVLGYFFTRKNAVVDGLALLLDEMRKAKADAEAARVKAEVAERSAKREAEELREENRVQRRDMDAMAEQIESLRQRICDRET